MILIAGDIESTGLSPATDKIVEVALTEITADLEVEFEAHSLINPGMPIPPAVSAVHHITDAMVADAPSIEEFFGRFPALKSQPIVFIAHNAKFDMGFLKNFFHEDSQTLCTVRLAKHVYPDLENYKLQTIRYTFGLDAGRAHSADGDTMVLVNFLKHVAQETGMTVAEMIEVAKAPIAVKKMPFGMHKGKALTALPKDYVKWALGNIDNLDPDLRLALEAVL